MKLFDEGIPHPLTLTISEISIIQLDVDPGDECVVKGPNAIGCKEEDSVIEFQGTKKSCEASWSVLVSLMLIGNTWVPWDGAPLLEIKKKG